MATREPVQNHVWYCINNHAAEGYPPFAPCGCPTIHDVTVRPLEDSAKDTLTGVEVALGLFLATTHASDLDAGQQEMVKEALRRIEQVVGEL